MTQEEKARLERLKKSKEELRKKGDKKRTPKEDKTLEGLKKAISEIEKR